MNLVETVTTPSGNLNSTLNGQIQIDDARGLMRIYDPTSGANLVTIDRNGFLFNDGVRRRILIGRHATEGVGNWLSPPTEDVINLLDA